MTDEQLTRGGTDWEARLQEDEIIQQEDSGKSVVVLRGLQRLARDAGYVGSEVFLNYVATGEFGVFQCVYTAKFNDGTSWAGAADCNKSNTKGDFLSYPTAVAESRAEARALKKALGITMLAAEELALESGPQPTGKISGQVVRMIETILERKNIDVATLLRSVLSEERQADVVELKELTVAEGQKATQWVNKVKGGTSKKADRTQRKAELEKQIKGE